MKRVCGYSFGLMCDSGEMVLTSHAGIFYLDRNGVRLARFGSEREARMYAEAIMMGYDMGVKAGLCHTEIQKNKKINDG